MDTSLYKLKPYKTVRGIQANNDALNEEKDYWNDRIEKFKHGLIVFSFRGSRKAEIENAENNIKKIDELIKKNNERLAKKYDSKVSKVKDWAYRLTGAETAEEQAKIREKYITAVTKNNETDEPNDPKKQDKSAKSVASEVLALPYNNT